MKKTVVSMAILASTTSAFALIGPGPSPKPRTFCLHLSENQQGLSYVGDCDLTASNKRLKLELNENGCADGQAALQSLRVVIPSCPTFVQL